MHKRKLRQSLLQKRLMAREVDLVRFSNKLNKRLLSLECIRNAHCIMAFYSHKNEPDLAKFIHTCLDMGKHILLPKLLDEVNMTGVRYLKNSLLKKNKYGIPEPIVEEEGKGYEPEIVIVPGIAFDRSLHRIGFGGGYYDRFLGGKKVIKIGVCFDSHIIESIKTHEHDVPMDMVVIENQIFYDIP